jgi:hypothetical protein
MHVVFTLAMRNLYRRTRQPCATEFMMLTHICKTVYLTDVSWGVPLNDKAGFEGHIYWVWRWDTMTQLYGIPSARAFLWGKKKNTRSERECLGGQCSDRLSTFTIRKVRKILWENLSKIFAIFALFYYYYYYYLIICLFLNCNWVDTR